MPKIPSSTLRLAQSFPEVGQAYRALRDQIVAATPLDVQTRDLIIMTAYAMRGLWGPFHSHGRDYIHRGGDVILLKSALLSTLGAVTSLAEVVTAFDALDALVQAKSADGARR